jgi:hypothetical protein
MPARPSQKRGRPPKYGQPAKVVAVTLPIDVVNRLLELDDDLGWAIVSVVEKSQERAARGPVPEAQLVEVGGGQSLITIDPTVFRSLPDVRMVPLSETQAFLALESGRGMADLELAVYDRLAGLTSGSRHRPPLERLLDQLQTWRRNRTLSFETRSIILVGQGHRAKR